MMQNPATRQFEPSGVTQLPNQTQRWDKIRVEQLQNPSGEGSCHFEGEHTLFMSLSPRPLHYLQVQDGKTYNGLYRQGDILITPANLPLFVRWEGHENCLQIQLTAEFLHNIAQETFNQDGDHLQLMPQFQVRDSQIEAISMMLLKELQQEAFNNQLYLDSLAN